MPRDGSGVYSLPPSYLAVTGQTIVTSQHNPPMEDIAAALTGSLPRNGSAPMLATLNMGGSKVANSAAPTAPNDLATKAYIDAAIATVLAQVVSVPTGTIGMFAADFPPSGWLAANGVAVSRTTYAALFAVIGTKYGAGDGTTTFNVPQLAGEFPRFADVGRGVDPGRLVGTAQADEIKSHGHGVNDPGHAHPYSAGDAQSGYGTGGGGVASNAPNGKVTDANVTGVTIQSTGGTETRPRNVALLAMIKT